jgi:hypothetical protein
MSVLLITLIDVLLVMLNTSLSETQPQEFVLNVPNLLIQNVETLLLLESGWKSTMTSVFLLVILPNSLIGGL